MKTRTRDSILATTAVVLLTAGMASARFPGLNHSSRKSADIDFVETTKVPSGPTLQAGTYKVTLLDDSSTPQLGFYQNGKLVGQAPVKLVDQGSKSSETQVTCNTNDDHTQVVTELEVSGWTQKVLFSAPDASSGSGE